MSDHTEDYDAPEAPDVAPAPQDDEPIVVSLVRKEKPFQIQNADGSVDTYKLVELDGAQRDEWLTKMADRVKYDKGQSAGIKSFAGVQASLLSLAIRTAQNQRLSELAIQKWPASALNRLFTVVQKMNALDKDGQDEVKKS